MLTQVLTSISNTIETSGIQAWNVPYNGTEETSRVFWEPWVPNALKDASISIGLGWQRERTRKRIGTIYKSDGAIFNVPTYEHELEVKFMLRDTRQLRDRVGVSLHSEYQKISAILVRELIAGYKNIEGSDYTYLIKRVRPQYQPIEGQAVLEVLTVTVEYADIDAGFPVAGRPFIPVLKLVPVDTIN